MRRAVLVVARDRAGFGFIADAVRVHAASVLFVAGLGEAVGAIASGFQPDAIVVDFRFGMKRVGVFLRQLFGDAATRQVPVVGASDDGRALFQIAPRGRQRKVPTPSSPAGVWAFLDAVASEAP